MIHCVVLTNTTEVSTSIGLLYVYFLTFLINFIEKCIILLEIFCIKVSRI